MNKTKNFKLFLVSGIALAVSTSLHAQVTIGADIPPQKGALLELKEFDPSDPAVNNATATKGFLFPRVKLTDLDKLYPMYENDPDYNSDAQKRDSLNLAHSGLTVYSAVANTSAGIQEGLYVWDGTQWVRPVTEIPNANQEAHRMAL
ncbi:MAG: hypothetical protein LBG77_07285, partial [Dysgonamonadaceae bacterium]|nr:hypothetical protein [Dysgonamonadaceae bacterium]